MSDATFRDVCLDANDPAVLGAFWGYVYGRTQTAAGGSDILLEPSPDAPPSERLWINQVAEPRVSKTRVHLDIRMPTADPAPLLGAGATLESALDEGQAWWVLADPEGNVFCAFPPAPPEWGLAPVAQPTPFELVVDATDPMAIATWWAERTGATVHQREGAEWVWIEGVVDFPWTYWVFNPVPEPKVAKNRIHWDVNLTSPDPSAFLAAGATVLAEPTADTRWWVLADPEGNEFCAFPPE